MAATAGDAATRLTALKDFDETKTGVKGLVDSGITSIPSIFHHPNLRLSPSAPNITIPTIDLSLPRPLAVDLIGAASRDWGFFQIVNHQIPLADVENTISAVRSFHELPADVRSNHYSRGFVGGVSYSSNVDLYRSGAASWRDTVQVAMAPAPLEVERIPEAIREAVLAWDRKAAAVAREVMGMMCEGLGLEKGRLEEMSCLDGRMMVCHYYPRCPEPEKTVGTAVHTDPAVLTVLVQSGIGGLQVKKKAEDGEELWVDVKPIPGAIVINVGDLLQIISNDEYKSVEHRVLANPQEEARVSVGIFFNPGKRGDSDLYGPLPELVSPEKLPRYRNFTVPEFLTSFFSKGLSSKSPVETFKL